MEDKVLTRKAYSLMFLVLAVWSFMPYLLESTPSLLVFNKISFSFEFLFISISIIACHGTFYAQKHGYFAGVVSILSTIFYLSYEQLLTSETNYLQLATLVTMLVIFGIYSTVFKTIQRIRCYNFIGSSC